MNISNNRVTTPSTYILESSIHEIPAERSGIPEGSRRGDACGGNWRIRRGLSIAEVAAKAGINRNTLSALDHGKPGVAISAYITVLWVPGLERTLDGVAHPDTDTHGKTLEASRRPKRVGKAVKLKDEYDF